MIDIAKFQAQLRQLDALRGDDQINVGTVDRIQPQHADEWPLELDSSVRDALVNTGVSKLYRHQADAMSKSLSGKDVVLESPTASGKTGLIYLCTLAVV